MATAIEALEQAQAEATTTVTEEEKKDPSQIPAKTVDIATVMEQVEDIEDATRTGDLDRLYKQNRQLVLDTISPAARPLAELALETRERLQTVERKEAELGKKAITASRNAILEEYKESGLTAEMLKHCPDEAAMKEMAEQVKGLNASASDEKTIMDEKPASSAAGAEVKPNAAEKYKRVGIERGIGGLLNDWRSGAQ